MFNLTPEQWDLIGRGVLMTLWLTFASGLLSLVVGILLAVMRQAPLPPVRGFGAGYTEFFRNIPLLTVLFFIFLGVPITIQKLNLLFRGFDLTAGFQIPQIDAVTSAILGLGLYTAAYVGEVLRAGLSTVSKGNIEAARSLGLSFMHTMRHVQLPQALRATIPPLGTLLIALLKNTSLAGTITVADLLFQADFVGDRTFNPDILLIAGAIYIAMTLPLGALIGVVERRLAIQR
jgi:aspartate/glutamate/glutamine transport system permease protein